MSIPTPHITANKYDFAPYVLMPGDPKRAKFIAQNFLENAVLVNDVRGVSGYTGYFKGKKVSVMASGMGMPSIGIYAYELYNFYDVEAIIRVGSAGAIDEDLKVKDIVIGQAACTNSNFLNQYNLNGTLCPIADFELMQKAVNITKNKGINYKVGNLYSSDTFYDDNKGTLKSWQKMGVLAVEMETAGLYATAMRAKKKALTICTISDCPFTGESSLAKEREQSFTDMIEIALELVE